MTTAEGDHATVNDGITLAPGVPFWLSLVLYLVLPAIAGAVAIVVAMARRDTAREAARRQAVTERAHGREGPPLNVARWRAPLVAGTTILVLVIALFPQPVMNVLGVSRPWPAIAALFFVGVALSALAVFHAVRLIHVAGPQRWLGALTIMLCSLAVLMVLLPLTVVSAALRLWQ